MQCSKLRNLMSPSVARGVNNLQKLGIRDCRSVEEVITEEEEEQGDEITNEPLFPRLEKLYLLELPNLRHFLLRKCALQFSALRKMKISECPQMKTFVQQGTVSTPTLIEDPKLKDDTNKVMIHEQLFNSKVSCPNLEKLTLNEAHSITALCSHQLPTSYLSKLKELEVSNCGKLRNLMPPSVAKGLLNLQRLEISDCPSIEEVITEEEEQGEDIMAKESLFPQLKSLELGLLPKLGHFFLTKCALEFTSLMGVMIYSCPVMKTFVLGSVSTPSLRSLFVNKKIEDAEMKDDLNKAVHHIYKHPCDTALFPMEPLRNHAETRRQ